MLASSRVRRIPPKQDVRSQVDNLVSKGKAKLHPDLPAFVGRSSRYDALIMDEIVYYAGSSDVEESMGPSLDGNTGNQLKKDKRDGKGRRPNVQVQAVPFVVSAHLPRKTKELFSVVPCMEGAVNNAAHPRGKDATRSKVNQAAAEEEHWVVRRSKKSSDATRVAASHTKNSSHIQISTVGIDSHYKKYEV